MCALSALLRTHVYTIRYSTTRQNTHSYFLIAHTHIFSCTHIYIPSKYSGVNRCRVTSAYVLWTVVLSTHSRTSTFTLCDVLTSLRYTLRWENNVWNVVVVVVRELNSMSITCKWCTIKCSLRTSVPCVAASRILLLLLLLLAAQCLFTFFIFLFYFYVPSFCIFILTSHSPRRCRVNGNCYGGRHLA